MIDKTNKKDEIDKLSINIKSLGPTKKKQSIDFEIETFRELDNLADKTGRSKNELVNMLIKYALKRVEVNEC
ncbi:MAG TPA: CopG family transcriptional regulator [Lachnospiraceae bacterium]|nr:CopG family transcriptional regulator [Lachnospiraceae bacterium]